MEIITDFPERVTKNKTVYLGETYQPFTIARVSTHNTLLAIGFAGFASREEVSVLTNKLVHIKTDELPTLPSGEYYHHQIIGLNVLDENDNALGKLESIIETGANDVYVVKTPDNKEILLPAIEDIILEVSLDKQLMRVRLPQWD